MPRIPSTSHAAPRAARRAPLHGFLGPSIDRCAARREPVTPIRVAFVRPPALALATRIQRPQPSPLTTAGPRQAATVTSSYPRPVRVMGLPRQGAAAALAPHSHPSALHPRLKSPQRTREAVQPGPVDSTD